MRKEKLEELKRHIENLKTINIEKSEKEAKFLSIETYNCTLSNKKVITRDKVLKNKKDGNAAIILPLTKQNNTILVIQPRVFTKRTVSIELPAGYIENNESRSEAAKRELIEETGYIPEKMILISQYYQDEGCMGAYNSSYLALNCNKVKEQNLDKDEFITYFECSYEEALELMEKGYINDASSIITLEKSKKYIKI